MVVAPGALLIVLILFPGRRLARRLPPAQQFPLQHRLYGLDGPSPASTTAHRRERSAGGVKGIGESANVHDLVSLELLSHTVMASEPDGIWARD